jgi:hypothetical protein
MVTCFSCGRGFHAECDESPCCCSLVNVTPDDDEVWQKEDKDIIDPKSTGRKRAAKLYPLDAEGSCEWQGLLQAGGGFKPIIGCLQGSQQNRHHGPDKDTLNNNKGNVHRICTRCHNRWHASNDDAYGLDLSPVVPFNHNTELKASDEELIMNEASWASIKIKKGKLATNPND